MNDMELHELQNRKRGGYTTFGAVWSRGEVLENKFRLLNQQEKEIPVQSEIRAYWPDGSIKWSAHTADSDRMGEKVTLLPEEQTECEENILTIAEKEDCYEAETGKLSIRIPKGTGLPADCLVSSVKKQGRQIAGEIYPVFLLEHRSCEAEQEGKAYFTENAAAKVIKYTQTQEYCGKIISVTLEQNGPLQAVFCFKGQHVPREESTSASMPFVIRMYLWAGREEIRFQHTFLYDGVETRDYLKGMGIRFDMKLTGKKYNRHVQFQSEGLPFHEAAVQLACSHPRLPIETLERQMAGEMKIYDTDSMEEEAAADLPVWNHYSIFQDSAWHYSIRKQTSLQCCKLICRQGKRAEGVMAVTGENAGLMLGIRDFWQKYPSGLEVNGLTEETAACTAWFYSPEAEAFDFRHYDTKSYPRSCYEGFEEVGASAYGIAVTSECHAVFMEKVPAQEELNAYGERMQKPCVYAASPEYYHEKRAFGYWSLPACETEAQKWLEVQLEKAFAFYKQETENRSWYGLFDYGDIMHSYDAVRHTWKYDVGGFAWQNTELVPTYWLWLYFLRTGREDVFTFAEAMTRHCSEVDMYHFGELKGLGSRHNVRHWGCSCKEPRISMAGHQRFLYYLTGDLRLGDVMDDVRDADYSMVKISHTQVKCEDGTERPGARSGPDWSSFVSNWMTAYERTLDERWKNRIQTGTKDIWQTPFGLASGPDYCYDVEKAHLIYRGEIEDTPNQHLQICMGGLQVWLETADMLGDDRLKILLERLGAFYFLNPEEKCRITEGKIKERPFSWPMLASGTAAYSAMRSRNGELAKQAWEILLQEVLEKGGREGYTPTAYVQGNTDNYQEIAWNTTNSVSQWCLNAIMCLEFIPEFLPERI